MEQDDIMGRAQQEAFNMGRSEGRVEGAEIMLALLLDHVNKMFHGTNEVIKTTASKAERTAGLNIDGALASIVDTMTKIIPMVPTMFDEVTAIDNSSENS